MKNQYNALLLCKSDIEWYPFDSMIQNWIFQEEIFVRVRGIKRERDWKKWVYQTALVKQG